MTPLLIAIHGQAGIDLNEITEELNKTSGYVVANYLENQAKIKIFLKADLGVRARRCYIALGGNSNRTVEEVRDELRALDKDLGCSCADCGHVTIDITNHESLERTAKEIVKVCWGKREQAA